MPKTTYSIYIPESMLPVWEEIQKAAKEELHGTGVYLCKLYLNSKGGK